MQSIETDGEFRESNIVVVYGIESVRIVCARISATLAKVKRAPGGWNMQQLEHQDVDR